MSNFVRSSLVFVLAGLVSSCGGERVTAADPTAQSLPGSGSASRAMQAGFFFLPPIARGPVVPTGVFDALATPTVEVCLVGSGNQCVATVITFSMSTVGSDGIRVDPVEQRYIVNWKTGASALDPARTYRVRVLLGTTELGHADLDVVPTGTDLRVVNGQEFTGLVNGSTLPISFRIEVSTFWRDLPLIEPGKTSAAPGALFELNGLDPTLPIAELSIEVAGQRGAIGSNGRGGYLAALPLFIDPATSWPAPPNGPQDVLVLRNGVPIAGIKAGMTILALVDAPGSGQRALTALTMISNQLSAFALVGPTTMTPERAYALAFVEAFEQMVNGSDPRSLAAVLSGASPEALRLLDAWFAASGVGGALDQYAALLGGTGLPTSSRLRGVAPAPSLAVSARRGVSPNVLASTTSATMLSDVELAGKMQLYEAVKLFSETLVAGFNASLSTVVGFGGLGLAAVGVSLPPAISVPLAITGLVCAVLDFTMNKIVVALLPSKLTAFTLSLTSTQLALGELTNATMRVVAANEPPAISLNDFTGLLLAGLGAVPSGEAQVLMQYVADLANAFLGVVQGRLTQIVGAFQIPVDVNITSMPTLQWEATIIDRRLIERLTSASSVIAGDLVDVNWRASLNTPGTADIQALPSFAPGAILITPPLGVPFNFTGAFGDEVLSSNTVTVVVGASVSVSPGTVTLQGLGTQQFTATVTGFASTAVTWTTDDPGGVVTSTGFYTSGTIPGIYSVTATSVADPTRSASATVQVQGTAWISISPASASVLVNGTRQFTATVLGVLGTTAVTWSATGGTIAADGVFTAGALTGSFIVTATSVALPSLSATATVTVVTSNLSVTARRNELSMWSNAAVQSYLASVGTEQLECPQFDDFSGINAQFATFVPMQAWDDDPILSGDQAGSGSASVEARQNTVMVRQPVSEFVNSITSDGELRASVTFSGGGGSAGATALLNPTSRCPQQLRQAMTIDVVGSGTVGFVFTASCEIGPTMGSSSTATAQGLINIGVGALFGSMTTSAPPTLRCDSNSPGARSLTVTGRLSQGIYAIGSNGFTQATAESFRNGSASIAGTYRYRFEITP
jgi:hypothetical protein